MKTTEEVKTRAIIIADGEGTRWKNHLGVPKHLIKIDGERLIDRAVRLLIENNVEDVYVVGPDDRYKVSGAKLYTATHEKSNGDLDKFMNSANLWNDDGKTIILYGDVYFTENAMKSIVEYNEVDFALHCRPFNSYLTGTPYGECFAITFYHQHREELQKVFHNIIDAFKNGTIKRMGGWEVYRFFMLSRGIYPKDRLHEHWLTGHNLNAINDWTDDFDYPGDYDRFIKRRAEL